MMLIATRRTLLAAAAATALIWNAGLAHAQVTLTYYIDDNPTNVATTELLKAAFEAENPDIVIEIETHPGGGEGDNLVKTRLATGEMSDVFRYNAGSLFQALNPPQNMLDLTDEPYQADIIDSFKPVVTAPDGRIYGIPEEAAMGGGVLYNKRIYEELGLSVPTSWAEFMANNEAIKAAGKAAVIQTFGDTWTSQLFVLADYFNVQAEVPDFADNYTANKAKYATTPAALRSFEKQQEVFEGGYLNADYAAATFVDGIRMVATGEGAHYPMLTFSIGLIASDYPEHLDDVGFFALPGDSESNGLTVWMPAAVYISKTTQHPEEARRFLAFLASTKGCDARTAANGATGPYLIRGCTLPDDVPPAVADLLPYFQTDGATAPALEFLSPIKGPALEHITVEVGSGIRSAADGAALYDEDVRKQAQQLGLAGW